MANENTNDDGFQAVVEDSFKDNSDNSDNSVNTDNSDNSNNLDAELNVNDSFQDNDWAQDNSDNSTNVDVDVDVDASDNSDNSVNDSNNDNSVNDNRVDDSIKNQDSFNITSSFNHQTLNDDSTTVGVRQYQTNVGDFNLGGLMGGKGWGHGGGAGDVNIDNRSVNFDQSVNQAISTGHGGDVSQDFSQSASLAFGDSSIAAGGDVSIDNSSFSVSVGDVNIGNTAINTTITDSFKDYSTNYDYDVDVDIDDSFNDNSTNTDVDVDIQDSFTSEYTDNDSFNWSNSGNIFSPHGATTGGETTEVDLDF